MEKDRKEYGRVGEVRTQGSFYIDVHIQNNFQGCGGKNDEQDIRKYREQFKQARGRDQNIYRLMH